MLPPASMEFATQLPKHMVSCERFLLHSMRGLTSILSRNSHCAYIASVVSWKRLFCFGVFGILFHLFSLQRVINIEIVASSTFRCLSINN